MLGRIKVLPRTSQRALEWAESREFPACTLQGDVRNKESLTNGGVFLLTYFFIDDAKAHP